jgi:hypothetical protein
MVLFEFDASALSVVERRKVSDRFDQTEEQSVVVGSIIKVQTNHPERITVTHGCRLISRSGQADTH